MTGVDLNATVSKVYGPMCKTRRVSLRPSGGVLRDHLGTSYPASAGALCSHVVDCSTFWLDFSSEKVSLTATDVDTAESAPTVATTATTASATTVATTRHTYGHHSSPLWLSLAISVAIYRHQCGRPSPPV